MRSQKINGLSFYTVAALLLLKMVLLRDLFYNRVLWPMLPGDLAPVLLLLGLLALIVPRRWKTASFWALNALVSVILFASSVYFNHFGSVPTYLALSELDQVFQVRDSVESTVQPVDYLFLADLAAGLIWLIVRAVFRRSRRGRYSPDFSASLGGAAVQSAGWRGKESRGPRLRGVFRIVVAVSVVGGGLLSAHFIRDSKGITNELIQAESAGFLNYEVVAALKTREENNLVGTGNINDTIAAWKQLESSYPYGEAKPGSPAYFGSQKGKNLIVVQMEAFQNFPLHQKLNGVELTPNLNKLADESFYFPQVFQQIGPGNTSDAEFMSNTSIYPIGSLAMSSGFGNRTIPSLPRLLESKGYEAYTFHVNRVGFWDRKDLYAAVGFTGYFDRPFFKDDHFGRFGASDEQLYVTGVEKLSELAAKKQPFYAQFVTVSSHHPFDVPKAFRKIEVPEKLQDTMLGDYLTAINYTDYAIGTLIDGLKKNGLWENTVIAFYGDHFGLQPQNVAPEQVQEALGIPYDSRISRYNIPFIIHAPGISQGQVIHTTGGQVDILPTIANLLGISLTEEKFTAFGHDLMNIQNNVVGMRYYLPTGSFFNNDIMFIPGKGFKDGKAVSLKTFETVSDFSKYERDYNYILKLLKVSDDYVKLLPER
ncbi:LTA synthase family protein [Paenibacillus glufosinatiresistens]|uniref:LTA synthase family protein n=1 Tax=Paenibacillus glufosinatiresistens TaxID=3070657 RepID=UPI00286EA20A|nr:LTA synthase family protein [Paenibacillus sp. YX.27]